MRNNDKHIDLSGEWTSSFVEDNTIFNEVFDLKQVGNKILADIKLNFNGETLNYVYDGVLKDDIINGMYEVVKHNSKENGVISLRIINKNLLAGVSTYISLNGDISQTPYTLTRKNPNKVGTFDLCSGCVGKKAVCCSNIKIDEPLIMPSEVKNIADKFNCKIEDFAKEIKLDEIYKDKSLKNMYQMKRNEDKTCRFYINNKCQIYDYRPIDCRIFPYDIKLENDSNYYLIYYITDECLTNNISINNISQISYTVRIFLRIIMPYIREWSKDIFSKNLVNAHEYKKICKIEDLF